MKPLRLIAFFIAGCTWGWFLGGCAPATNSYYMSAEGTKQLSALLGLIAGAVLGLIGGSVASRFLPARLNYVPVCVLVIGLVPLALVAITLRVDSARVAKLTVDAGKRDQEVRADAKKTLDGFARATGWPETGSYWNARWYGLAADPAQVQGQLVSLGATDFQLIPGSTTVSAKFPELGHQLYIQLSPQSNGGSRVMVQY